jgi:hypothetical protein
MILSANWLAWPGHEAFFVAHGLGPAHLIQVDRRELARTLARGTSLEQAITQRARPEIKLPDGIRR